MSNLAQVILDRQGELISHVGACENNLKYYNQKIEETQSSLDIYRAELLEIANFFEYQNNATK